MARGSAFTACIVILLTAVAVASDPSAAQLDLPEPTGRHHVGTKTVVLKDLHRNRDLPVTMWYPAAPSRGDDAPYMDQRTADAVAEDWELRPGFERDVHTNAKLLAPFAEGDQFPVVLLDTVPTWCQRYTQYSLRNSPATALS